MIFEIAEIRVQDGQEEIFERGVARAAPLFQGAKGCRSFALQRSIETPSLYLLVVGWETVEDHMVAFRQSPSFQAWRDLVGGTFAEPPKVQHVRQILQAF